MPHSCREGERVKWKWRNDFGHGSVKSRFNMRVARKVDGSDITRDGSEENPACYVDGDDGGSVLKLKSELESAYG